MAEDPLRRVLGLVAEGRLTAEEAAPILAAFDGSPPGPSAAPASADAGATTSDGPAGPAGAGERPGDADGRAAATLRIEVRDRGRTVVNLRLPVGVGRFALDRVPGLSGDQVARVRDALRAGVRGPVLEVADDEGGGVRIGLE